MLRRSLAIALLATAAAAVPAVAAAGHAPTTAHARAAATRLKRVHRAQQVRVSIDLRIDHAGVRRRLHGGHRAPLAVIIRRHHADDAAIAAVREWARRHGLAAHSNPMRTRVVVSGPASRIEQAFAARLFVYRPPTGSEYVAADAPVPVPAALAPVAEGVSGIEHGLMPVGRPGTADPAVAPPAPAPDRNTKCRTDAAAAPPGGAGPAMLPWVAKQYGIDTIGTTTGATAPKQTVAVVEFDQQYSPSDVALIQDSCGLAPAGSVQVSQVNLPGAITTPQTEAQLDTQLLAALAPAGTSIVVVNAHSSQSSWPDVLDAVAKLPNLTVVSVSYGSSEMCDEMGQCDGIPSVQQAEAQMEALAASGVTFTVSSGDQGSMGPPMNICADQAPLYGLPGYASVNFPASSPAVTAVGGTMWGTGATLRTAEAVWNEPAGLISWPCVLAGTGGGQSVFFTRPTWQAVAGQVLPGRYRLAPDVSLLAGQPGYFIVQGGRGSVAEGTSASAPLMAAAVLRMNSDQLVGGDPVVGFLNPTLYSQISQDHTAITDLTTGSNDVFLTGTCCSAGPGYDQASGLGVPNFAQWEQYLP